jgi:hypothetical protein
MPFNPRHHTQEALVLVKRDRETLEIHEVMVCPNRGRAMSFVSNHPEWEMFLTQVVDYPHRHPKVSRPMHFDVLDPEERAGRKGVRRTKYVKARIAATAPGKEEP